MRKNILIKTLMLSLMSIMTAQAQQLPYQDTSLSFHERAVDLVSRLTLAEKAQQMGNMVENEINRDGINIPAYQYWNEALHGVARSGAATSFPESKGMSSTWDKQLIFDCATVISDEARIYNNVWNKGLNYWCPTINMARDPRWGRDEENYGEDPFLAGVLAVQFIKGMQGNDPTYLKTVACAKHFAANNYEQGRQGSTSYMTKHNLREYYLPAFEMSVKEGKVKSIMSSYNALSTDINEENANGQSWAKGNTGGKAWGGKPNAMNDWLLTGILRNEWGFDGYVTSDCAGVSCIYRNVKHGYFGPNDDGSELQEDYKARATAAAIKAGNDMNCEFKNQTSIFQTAVEAAISKGYMTEEDLDQALIRVLETRFALGEFDGSTPWSSLNQSDLESTANQAMALKAAQESIVLLKNGIPEGGSNPLLPISTEKSVALIGPYANQIQLGDYSGTPTYTTTPFQAFATKMNFTVNDGTIQAESFTSKSEKANGVDASYPNELANTAPGVWFCYANVDFGTTPCKDFIMACAAKNTGVATVNFILDDPDGDPFLSVDNVDNNSWHSMTTVNATIDEAKRPSGVHTLYVKFTGSNKYAGNYDYFRFYNEGANPYEDLGPLYMVQTTDAVNDVASEEMIARAVAVAQKADVVVFCGGTDFSKPADHATGTESHDRWKLTMPGNQTALLQALYAVNKNIVLVLETNSSMDITWEKANLPAILEAWYGGQAQGQAICDVIYGDVNPSGKLTSTWYNSIDELPSESDSQFGAKGMLEYNIDDWGYTYMYYKKGTGANVSRQAAAPMYPFGYGLSYTTFAYSNPTIASDHVTFTITNTGTRAGAEVAQVYVSFPNSAVSHIQKLNRRLVGFERVELAAGQSKEVTIPINKDQLAYYNDDTDEWWVEGGQVNVYISASSADDRLTGSFVAAAEKLDRTVGGDPEPEPEEPITGISIPTAAESYILWNDANATIENATVENEGANIGSTGASTVATFAIGNNTKQDYILTFKTGSKNAATMLVTLTNKKTSDVVLSKTVDILNTGSWTPSTVHTFLLSQLPKGNYELKMKVTEATSYAGNWGNLAFYATDNYNKAPGTIGIATGTYNGPKLENNNTNVGYVSNGGTASYSFICSQDGVYKMTVPMTKYGDGTIHITVTDDETGNVEADNVWTMVSASNYENIDIPVDGELTYGMKTLTMQFATTSSFLCNYKDITMTRIADHYAKVNGVSIENQTVTEGTSTDWYCQLPINYDATTTFGVTAPYGTVAVTAKDDADSDVAVTDNGNGTYTIATPGMGRTTIVTMVLTPNDGTVYNQTTYTLKLFRIGEISLTAVTVDGVAIDVLDDINNSEISYTATYDACYTTAPTVAATQIDEAAATVDAPVVNGSIYTYTIHGAIGGTDIARDYTLILNNVHVYEATGDEQTADIKANGGTIANNTWSNGIYTLATNSLDSYNQWFKMNGNSYTLSVPSDVVVKQLIMKDVYNSYAGNDARLTAVTSTDATAYIPVENKYYHDSEGEKHDIIVNIDDHTAGTDIVLTQQKKGQPCAWIQLTITKQNPGTAPAKTAQNVTVVNNHAVVTVTFDREIPNDVTATINGGTVTAEGGSATLRFPIWNLSYSTNYTLSIAAGAVKDAYNNTNESAIEIAVNTDAKPVVAKATYDYVVSTADELKTAIAAIDATNKTAAAERKIIFLKNGTYNLGGDGSAQTVQWVNAHNISFIGESKEGVIICGTSADISNPVLNIRYGSGQYMQDLTVRNLKDFDQSERNGVSVAVYGGNKAIFKNVAMQAQQDTQVTGERSYAVDCDFYGAVDFLCGGGDHYYDHCNFYITNSGYITAPSTSSANKWGYVMQNCTIDKYVGSYTYEADGHFTLGRPWQGEPRNYWLNTTMKAKPSTGGWSGMGKLTTHFYEYNSMDANGDAIDLSGRVNSSTSTNTYTPILSAEEAAKFTIENVMGGTDSWLPTDECPVLAAPVATFDGATLSWTEVDDARCYVVFKNGQYLANQTGTTYEVTSEGVYSVRAANLNGGLGAASTGVVLKRTIAAGKWSTIVLPIDMTAEQVTTTFGNDAEVAELTSFVNNNLHFELASGMNANEPYLIRLSHDFASASISDVAIVSGTPIKTDVEGVEFVGTYESTVSIPFSNSEAAYYFLSNNQFYQTAESGTPDTMNTLRAYFKVPVSGPGARSLTFDVEGETTGISQVDNSKFSLRECGAASTVDSYYDLQGRKVAQPTKGLYIVNGKKVIVK
jgi:beta-glucosidase